MIAPDTKLARGTFVVIAGGIIFSLGIVTGVGWTLWMRILQTAICA